LKIAERPNSRALQEPAPDLPQAASAAQTAPDIGAPLAPAASSPEVQQALEVMARDLADLRQTVNQLVVGQEQMARDIATLQAAEKDLRPRISAPEPAAAPAQLDSCGFRRKVSPTQLGAGRALLDPADELDVDRRNYSMRQPHCGHPGTHDLRFVGRIRRS
jgi:hypothetical protein